MVFETLSPALGADGTPPAGAQLKQHGQIRAQLQGNGLLDAG